MSLPAPASFAPTCSTTDPAATPTTCPEPPYPLGNCIPWRPYETMHAITPYPTLHERPAGHSFFTPGTGLPATASAAFSSLYYSHPTFQNLAAAGLILPSSEAFFKPGPQRFPPPPPGLQPPSYFPIPASSNTPGGMPRHEHMFRGLPELNLPGHSSHIFFPNYSGPSPFLGVGQQRKSAPLDLVGASQKSIPSLRYSRQSLDALAAIQNSQLAFGRKSEDSSVNNNIHGANESEDHTDSYTKGTLIKLANGALRRVEDLKTEDFVQSVENHPMFRMVASTVKRIEENHTERRARIELIIGKDNKQVVLEVKTTQPFFVLNQGWASCDPRNVYDRYSLPCKRLDVGDICISLIRRTSSRQKDVESEVSEVTPMDSSDCTQPGFPLPVETSSPNRLDKNRTTPKNWTSAPNVSNSNGNAIKGRLSDCIGDAYSSSSQALGVAIK